MPRRVPHRPSHHRWPAATILIGALLVAFLAPAAGAAPLELRPPAGTTTAGERLAVDPEGGAELLTPTVEGPRYLTHLLPDGTVDTAWGTGGWSNAPSGEWRDIAVDAEGRILLVGSLEGDLAVARLTPAGTPDPSFGDAGIARVHLGPPALEGLIDETLERLVVQPDGSILAAGWATLCAEACRSTSGVVVKLTPDGALERSFGEGGYKLLARVPRPEPGHGKGVLRKAFALAVQPDGKILVGGNDYRLLVVLRLSATGAVDTSFGERGAFFTAQETEGEEGEAHEEGGIDLFHLGSAIDLLVEGSGRIVAVGDQAMFGVLPDGRPDRCFGGCRWAGGKWRGEGMVGTGASTGDALLDAQGRIVVVGNFESRPSLVRFLPDGRLDRTFGHRGLMPVHPGSVSLEILDSPPMTGLGLLPGGLLLAAGYDFLDRTNPHSKVLLLRDAAG